MRDFHPERVLFEVGCTNFGVDGVQVGEELHGRDVGVSDVPVPKTADKHVVDGTKEKLL